MKHTRLYLSALLFVATAGAAHTIALDETQRRARAGDPEAERELGQAYLTGQGVPQNIPEAVSWLQQAADKRDPFAAFLLAEHYATLPPTPANHNEQVRYLRQAATLGHTTAQTKLGEMLLKRSGDASLSQDQRDRARQQGLSLLDFAAKSNNALAMLDLGRIYLEGQYGTAKDVAKAESYYRDAAGQRQGGASMWLGQYYLDDPSSAHYNPTAGITQLQDAVQYGVPDAALLLARHYATGDGVAKDQAEAAKWGKVAQEHGVKGASELLASLSAPPAAQAATKTTVAAAAPVAKSKPSKAASGRAPAATAIAGAAPTHDTPSDPSTATTQAVQPTPAHAVAVLKAPAETSVAPASSKSPTNEDVDARITAVERRLGAVEMENAALLHEIDVSREEMRSLNKASATAAVENARANASNAAIQHAQAKVTAAANPNPPGPVPRRPVAPPSMPVNRVEDPQTTPPNPVTGVALVLKDGISPPLVPSSETGTPKSGSSAAAHPSAEVSSSQYHETPPAQEPAAVASHDASASESPAAHEATGHEAKATEVAAAHATPPADDHSAHVAASDTHSATAAAAPSVAAVQPAAKAPAVPVDADFANEQGVQSLRAGDYAAARNLFEQSSMGGNHRAMNNLGMLYFRGLGVDRNLTAAIGCFERAAHAGDPGAANNLGYVYQYGVGVSPDRIRAAGWYRRAIELGNTASRKALQQLVGGEEEQPQASSIAAS